MSDHHAAPSGEKASLLSNILAIIGLIILVIIIVWGLVHVASLSSGWFTSLFQGSSPTITVTAPKDTPSGAPVTVSWDYTTTASGSYAFLYQCQRGFEFAVINTTTNTASGIPCGAAFSVTPTNKSIVILPLLSGTTSASVPFSILFIPTSGTQVQGSATMIVHPGSALTTTRPTPTPSTKPTTTVTTRPASTPVRPVVHNYNYSYSPADISVRIVSHYVDQYGNGTVTFNIANVGGSTSGTYYFSAQLPTSNMAPYVSAIQAPLTPGSYISNTLHFTQAHSGTFSVAVHAYDRNQSNDYVSLWINAPVMYQSYQGYQGGTGYSSSVIYNSYQY